MSLLARFFVPITLHTATKNNAFLELEGSSATHIRVLRLQVGDVITLFDGHGGEYLAELTTADKRQIVVMPIKYIDIERESAFPITLVQALATGDKMDWVVQKAVELGVHSIQPINVERSAVRLTPERANKRIQHWRAIAISACEQCGRNRIPTVYPVIDFSAWLTQPTDALRLMLHPNADIKMMEFPPISTAPAVSLVIGPEGGFSNDELQCAQLAQIAMVRLGLRVLRTETAGIAALSILQSMRGDLA